jgi:hypothetical protein
MILVDGGGSTGQLDDKIVCETGVILFSVIMLSLLPDRQVAGLAGVRFRLLPPIRFSLVALG